VEMKGAYYKNCDADWRRSKIMAFDSRAINMS